MYWLKTTGELFEIQGKYIYIYIYIYAGADPEILKRGGALCRLPWLAEKENLRFQVL